jgi:hypothetical protein
MAEMISPAGNMEVKVLSFGRDGNKLVAIGQMGVWDAKIYITPKEVFQIMRLMLNASILGYIATLPFLYFASNRHQKLKKSSS